MNSNLFKFENSKWEAQSTTSITWNGIKSTEPSPVSPCGIGLYSSTDSSNLGCDRTPFTSCKKDRLSTQTKRRLTHILKKIQKEEKKPERKAWIRRAQQERKRTMRWREAATLTWASKHLCPCLSSTVSSNFLALSPCLTLFLVSVHWRNGNSGSSPSIQRWCIDFWKRRKDVRRFHLGRLSFWACLAA